jgi:protein TonB
MAVVAAPVAVVSPAARPPVPVHPLQQLFSPADYPARAEPLSADAKVAAALKVDTAGRVRGCAILMSSGVPAVDATTCRILYARSRFAPARDAAGAAVEGDVVAVIAWPRSRH